MRFIINYITVLFMLLGLVAITAGQADYIDTPIQKENLIRSSKRQSIAKERNELIKAIRASGVDFVVTPAVEAELLAGGVKPDVIRAAKESFRFQGSTKRPSYLTLTSNIDATEFTIPGLRSVVGNVAETPILPGTYQVTARRSGYSKDTQTADLSIPGSRRALSFILKPMSVGDLLTEAESAIRQRQYSTVEENAREVLRREPVNAKASILLGQAYYVRGDFDQALDPFVRGITGGEPAVFGGARGKGGSWAGVSLSPGRFVLRANALAFISGEKDDFDVPYAKIEDLKVGQSESVFMNVRVPKSGGKGEEKKEFKFYPTTAQPAVATGRLVTCNCIKESTFVVNLITELRLKAK